jgi:transposase
MTRARPHRARRLLNDANASWQLKISQAQTSWKHKMAQLLARWTGELHRFQAEFNVGRFIESSL